LTQNLAGLLLEQSRMHQLLLLCLLLLLPAGVALLRLLRLAKIAIVRMGRRRLFLSASPF